MQKVIERYFSGIKSTTVSNLSYMVEGIMRSGSAGVWKSAQAMSALDQQSHSTNEKKGKRLLRDDNFQIDDKMFRKYINLLFDTLTERNLLKIGGNLQINVDHTSDTDEFLILMASVNFGGRSVPLFFSIRSYPRRKNSFNQKKMESTFIKGLRHILSKKYNYTIVADRGFGNNRFAQLYQENGFDFVVRIKDNLKIKREDREENLQKYLGRNTNFDAYVESWNQTYHFEIQTKNGSTWFLIMPKGSSDGAKKYEKRFAIEKFFQDQKSSGVDIEKK